ncbi:hypothetical protein B0H34DRAFT_736740 [Crassisporium funariophilum]|nr:hypothetical protein B0H34DRAFT_736740 [Crassisporium funariophilum]
MLLYNVHSPSPLCLFISGLFSSIYLRNLIIWSSIFDFSFWVASLSALAVPSHLFTLVTLHLFNGMEWDSFYRTPGTSDYVRHR